MDAPYAVRLVLPAQADSARLARLVAAALATDAHWTIDDTEDLRIAVSELFALLVEDGEASAHEVELDYRRWSDTVEISGRRSLDDPDATPKPDLDPDDLALEILRVVVDEHTYTQDAAGRHFHLVKQARNRT